eukprot:SAG22_NODE_554_length_9135_cov_3.635569_7_plen_82_part_00
MTFYQPDRRTAASPTPTRTPPCRGSTSTCTLVDPDAPPDTAPEKILYLTRRQETSGEPIPGTYYDTNKGQVSAYFTSRLYT